MNDSISSGKKDAIHLGSAQNKAIHAKEGVGKAVIEYHKKNVYGNEQKYVTNPEHAAHISKLTGTKTLMDHHIAALQALGHEVKHVPQN